MHYAELRPPTALDPWIECVWTLRGSGAGIDPVLPDGRTEIVLNFGDAFRRHGRHAGTKGRRHEGTCTTAAGEGHFEIQAHALFVGPMAHAALLEPGPIVDVMGIRLRPAAAAALLRTPMRELEDHIPALDDVAPRLSRLLEHTGNATDRVATVLDLVGRELLRAGRPDARITRVVRLIEGVRGDAAVDLAARAAAWSPRQLQRRFLEEVGLTPKTFSRVIRLQAAARAATHARDVGWARIAAACGFFDQAHLIREFRKVAGRTPATFFSGGSTLGGLFTGT